MTTFAIVALFVYAGLMLVGGIIGYRAAGSTASLIAGIASSVVLLATYGLTRVSLPLGFLSAAVVALALTAVFLMRFRTTGNFMPSGMLMALSIIALVIFLLAGLRAR